MTGQALGGLALVAGLTVGARQSAMLDGRDRQVLSGAHRVQSGPMLATLAIWLIGLQESYAAAGAVPVFWLYLVFWSCLVVSLMALPVGVLVGYRRP
jgi:hypothetical protein